METHAWLVMMVMGCLQIAGGFANVPGPPRLVRLAPLNSTALRVEWRPPVNQERSSIIRGYKIFYVKFNDRDQPTGDERIYNPMDGGTKNDTILPELQPDTWYQVQLAAFTRTGDGRRSDFKKARTKGAVYCPYPGRIENGTILLVGVIGKYDYRPYVKRIGHNDKIEYRCDKGHKRVGPPAATCVDGEWSPHKKPRCKPDSEVIYGNDIKNRRFTDAWSSAIFITEAHKPIRGAGTVEEWKIYAKRKGKIYMQIWRPATGRPSNRRRFTLVGQNEHQITALGENVIAPDSTIRVEKGDVVGFHFRTGAVIPFDGSGCYGRETLYVKSPRLSSVRPGATFNFTKNLYSWKSCRTYSWKLYVDTGADFRVREIGNNPTNRSILEERSNTMVIPDASTPLPAGRVIGWQFYASLVADVTLLILRPNNITSTFTLVGQATATPADTGVFTTHVESPIIAQKGDVYGLFFNARFSIPFDGHECREGKTLYSSLIPLVQNALQYTFHEIDDGLLPCREYSLKIAMLL